MQFSMPKIVITDSSGSSMKNDTEKLLEESGITSFDLEEFLQTIKAVLRTKIYNEPKNTLSKITIVVGHLDPSAKRYVESVRSTKKKQGASTSTPTKIPSFVLVAEPKVTVSTLLVGKKI